MEVRVLRYALEIYRQKSFTKAANRLHIAQPSLSQQIGKLEKELGVTLFYRTRNEVEATPEGLQFMKRAEKIVRAHDDLLREMKDHKEGIGSTLTIGTPAVTGGYVLPPLIQMYLERYPQVEIKLVEETPAKLEQLILEGKVDLAVLSLPVENEKITTHTMVTEPLFLAVPRKEQSWMPEKLRNVVRHAGKKAYQTRSVPIGDVQEAPFILLKEEYGFRRIVLDLCAEAGFQPNVHFLTSNMETAQSFVVSGLGVTIVPLMVTRERTDMLYLPLEGKPTRTLVFAYREDRYLSNVARTFMDTY
ncbi:LysR family transcriptional regulator [Shimazuella sp. AN120528]|uniref:LysR family transcriptional regulator n=1 Tax=Shimazuella soli TaxID=1892854 RepID=UPI001F110F16|nr:LysR family transcriptional regulator [Shimazuella soli]MCH5585160.1 LysR family transcriptional regulator [Shimazuella soli]